MHPCDFPSRVAPDGTPVRTYDAFISYLERKDPRIRRATLPIGGRNTVLWLDPEATPVVAIANGPASVDVTDDSAAVAAHDDGVLELTGDVSLHPCHVGRFVAAELERDAFPTE